MGEEFQAHHSKTMTARKSRGVAIFLGVVFTPFLLGGVLMAQDNDGWEELNNYTGTIAGNLKVGMTLIMTGNDVSGVYFYNKWLQDIPVKGNMDSDRGIVLNEYDQNGKVKGMFKGHCLDHAVESDKQKTPLKCEAFEGVWSRPDGVDSKPFRLVMDNATYRPIGYGRYHVAGFNNDKDVEMFAQNVWKAIIDANKEKVASMIAYPLNVQIGRKNVKIKNKKSFIKNYDQIFYKSFYEKIKKAVPHNMFTKSSGVMFGDGEIWIGPQDKGIYVVAINNWTD